MKLGYWIFAIGFTSASLQAQDKLQCGVASGFPPYQFEMDGKPAGVDVDILKAVARKAHKQVAFVQSKWDDVIALLRLGRINCVAGMEITGEREKYYDFTDSFYRRKIVVFTMASRTDIASYDDLKGRKVTSDRQSLLENEFLAHGLLSAMRVIQTESKEESMKMLGHGEVDAVIAPLEVGQYVARQLALKVRVLNHQGEGAPVAIAIKKGDHALRQDLERAVRSLKEQGVITEIVKHWLPETEPNKISNKDK